LHAIGPSENYRRGMKNPTFGIWEKQGGGSGLRWWSSDLEEKTCFEDSVLCKIDAERRANRMKRANSMQQAQPKMPLDTVDGN